MKKKKKLGVIMSSDYTPVDVEAFEPCRGKILAFKQV